MYSTDGSPKLADSGLYPAGMQWRSCLYDGREHFTSRPSWLLVRLVLPIHVVGPLSASHFRGKLFTAQLFIRWKRACNDLFCKLDPLNTRALCRTYMQWLQSNVLTCAVVRPNPQGASSSPNDRHTLQCHASSLRLVTSFTWILSCW